MPSSSQHQRTFCTFEEFARPQIFNMVSSTASVAPWKITLPRNAIASASWGSEPREGRMELGLEGKVAIVTGASRGIGAAIAVELAQEGCEVVLTARTREGLEATASRIEKAHRRALVHVADLRDPAAPAELAKTAVKAFGRVDLVVCNAGATKRGNFTALTDEDWADGFALKFTAHRRLVSAAWEDLARAKGSILFISGIGGRTPGAEFTIGGSVNAAILSL